MKNFQNYYNQVKNIVTKEHPKYSDEAINEITQEIIDMWPIELEQNFFEWINEKPLSDIKIYDLSINEIFNVWHKDIPNATYPDMHLALSHINYYMNVPEHRRKHCKRIILKIHNINADGNFIKRV